MGRSDILITTILNAEKTYSIEQFKTNAFIETNEQAVSQIFKVLCKCIEPNGYHKIINKSDFFSNTSYYLNEFLNVVDKKIFGDYIEYIFEQIKEKKKTHSIDASIEKIITQLDNRIIEDDAYNNLVNFDNVEDVKGLIGNREDLINWHDLHGHHFILVIITKYIESLLTADCNGKTSESYHSFLNWLLDQPFLTLLEKEKNASNILLEKARTYSDDVGVLQERISRHINKSNVLDLALKTRFFNASNIKEMMQSLSIDSYDKMFMLLITLFDKEMNKPVKFFDQKTMILFSNTIKACSVLLQFFSGFDSGNLEIIEEMIKTIRARFDSKRMSDVRHNLMDPSFRSKISEALLAFERRFQGTHCKEKKSNINDVPNRTFDLVEKQTSLLAKYNVSQKFSSDVTRKIILINNLNGVIDFTSQGVITIDEDKSPDLDDAPYLETDKDGYTLYVHISDVYDVLKNNPLIKAEALNRGTSIYLTNNPKDTINMLPECLSLGYCSLIKGQRKNVFTHIIRMDKNGNVLSYNCIKGVINVSRRLSYIKADEILENGDSDRNLERMLNHMSELAAIIKSKYGSNRIGSALHDEFSVRRNVASSIIIEEFSILANHLMAKDLLERGLPAEYRVHQAPASPTDPTPRAVYQSENIGHYGLGLDVYTHGTSPIRRFCDVVIQEIVDSLRMTPNPSDKTVYYYEDYVKEVAPIITDKCYKASRLEKQYNQLLAVSKILLKK